jgi:hypothetical protein
VFCYTSAMERLCRICKTSLIPGVADTGGNGRICVSCNREEKARQVREKLRANGAKPRYGHIIDELGRQCVRCKEYKNWDEYHASSRSKPTKCKPCHNVSTTEGRIRRKFGLSAEEYNWLLEAQLDSCALCEEPETAKFITQLEGKTQRLSVDHFHGCGAGHKSEHGCKKCIRGLLCKSCNVLLGHVEGKKILESRFEDYLSRRPFSDS